MNSNQTSEAALRDFYRALTRHRGKSVLVFCAVLATTLLATWLMPRTYVSESQLFVRLGRENSTLGPAVTMASEPVVVAPAGREEELNTVAAVIGSRTMLEGVVGVLGADRILAGGLAGDVAGGDGQQASQGGRFSELAGDAVAWLRRLVSQRQPAPHDRAVRHLEKRLTVAPLRRSNLVELSYQGESPELAQQVVATLVDAYLQAHVRLNRVAGSQRFFSQQADRLQQELVRLEDQLADLKASTGLASIDDQRAQLIDRIGRLQDQLTDNESEHAETQAKVIALRDQLEQVPDERIVEVIEGVNDSGTDGIRQQFFTLQLQEKQAASIYEADHPKLRAIREELAAAQQIHDGEQRTRVEVKTAPDSLREQLRQLLAVEQPILDSLVAKGASLQEQLTAVRGDLDQLSAHELAIARLTRQIDLKEADYRKYAINLEQARIDDELESQRMSNIALAQPATLEPRPVKPRVLVNLVLGLLVAIGGALCIALLAEYLDRTFRTPEQVERGLGIPTLVTVPKLQPTVPQANGVECER